MMGNILFCKVKLEGGRESLLGPQLGRGEAKRGWRPVVMEGTMREADLHSRRSLRKKLRDREESLGRAPRRPSSTPTLAEMGFHEPRHLPFYLR